MKTGPEGGPNASIEEACAIIGQATGKRPARQTVYRWIDEGKIPFVKGGIPRKALCELAELRAAEAAEAAEQARAALRSAER